MKPDRVATIAVVLAVIVTLYSLSELRKLSQAEEMPQVPETGPRWKAIAERAVQHVEHIHRGRPTHGSELVGHQVVGGQPNQSETKAAVPAEDAARANAIAQLAQLRAGASHTATKKPDHAATTEKQADAGSAVATSPCSRVEHTELWGEVVVWGNKNKVDTWQECCDMCRNYKPPGPDADTCNVWVFCGDKQSCGDKYRECWLKHLVRPEATKPARQGPEVPWSGGIIYQDPETAIPRLPSPKDAAARRFHTVTTAQGAAVHWQARVHYYWFKKQKAACEAAGQCAMGGFTRLLHSGKADDLMDEIPTVVVDPLPNDNGYVVLNRPYALAQWVKIAKIPEKYVLMAEPDHIFLRPMPNFMHGDTPAAFPFFYIEPSKAEYRNVTMKFTGQISKAELEQIAPIGNSPTYMAFEDMKKVMPIWLNTSLAIFKDQEANKAWGWVQEMYGFTIALFLGGIRKTTLYLEMAAQPPWDSEMELAPGRPFYILHYTYGNDFTRDGVFTPGKYGEWRFDKRTYASRPPPRNLTEPPKKMKHDMVRTLINSINEATANIPCWDKYQETGVVTPCDEGKAAAKAAA